MKKGVSEIEKEKQVTEDAYTIVERGRVFGTFDTI
jgi:hypothetical protein